MHDIYLVTSRRQMGGVFSGLYTDKRRAEYMNDRYGHEAPVEVIPVQLDCQVWLWCVSQRWLF
jgi:hypothetical protein